MSADGAGQGGGHGSARPRPSERYLVIANKTGQLGDRLTVYAHMIGAARERGWTLLNPSFCEYAEHFLGTCGRLLTCGEAEPTRAPSRCWSARPPTASTASPTSARACSSTSP